MRFVKCPREGEHGQSGLPCHRAILRGPFRHCGGVLAPCEQGRQGLLPLWALDAVVANRRLHVRGIDFDEFREHVHRIHSQLLPWRELEVVGVSPHGHAHGVRLFQAVGALRRQERHRVLRASLLGQGRRVPARLPRHISRAGVQRDNDRSRDAGGDKDRPDAFRRRAVDGCRGHGRRLDSVFRRGRIPRCDIHGLLPLRRHNGRRGGGHVLRREPSGRRRLLCNDVEPRRAEPSVVLSRSVQHRSFRRRVRDSGRDPVVERVVSRFRAGWRRLYRPAHAFREERRALRRRLDTVPGRQLCDPSVAVVPHRLRFAHRVPRPRVSPEGVPERQSCARQGRPRLSSDAYVRAERLAWSRRGFHDGRSLLHGGGASLHGVELHRQRLLEALRPPGGRRARAHRRRARHGRSPHGSHRRDLPAPHFGRRGLQPDSADRRGHWTHLSPEVVLDAHQRVERDHGNGRLVRGGRIPSACLPAFRLA